MPQVVWNYLTHYAVCVALGLLTLVVSYIAQCLLTDKDMVDEDDENSQ